jgi:hypothetical protein
MQAKTAEFTGSSLWFRATDSANGSESTSGEPLELRRAEQTRIVSRDRLCASNSVVNLFKSFVGIMDFYPSWKALFGKLAQDSPKLTDLNGYASTS